MFGFFILFTSVLYAQNELTLCNNKQIETLNFDDVIVNTSITYIALPRPYHNFVFRRINTNYTGYIDDGIPVNNITNLLSYHPDYTFYQNAYESPPNIIFTTGENLSIEKSDNSAFNIIKLYMKSIFIDNMAIILQSYKNGIVFFNKTVTVSAVSPTEIFLNWRNIDQLIIGCLNPQFETCAHVSYDDITVCY